VAAWAGAAASSRSIAIVFAVVTITFFVVHLAKARRAAGNDRCAECASGSAGVRVRQTLLTWQYVKYLAALVDGKMG